MSKILSSEHINLDKHNIGSKANGLIMLKRTGFNCPNFYVLDYEFLIDIANGSCNLNEELQIWIKESKIDSNKLWAVRSSTQDEDGDEKSFAGLFTTEINVKTDLLAKAIDNVHKSYASLENDLYSQDIRTNYGIIIQEMINPEYSGVIFSHNPESQKDETVFMNVIPGLGDNLVSGKEEAFVVKSKSGKLIFDDIQQNFIGEIFEGELISVSKSSDEIKTDLYNKWKILVKGAKKLSKIRSCGVDIEFCIANNQIYWLQVRPITTGKDEPCFWDNTASEGNYPGIILPLSIDLIKISFSKAYRGLAKFLGMPAKMLAKNENLLSNMTGEIFGAFYYNITAWQKLLYQLPFGSKISKKITLVWGMDKAEFYPDKVRFAWIVKVKMFFNLMFSIIFLKSIKKKYIKRYDLIQNKIDSSDLKSKSYPELVELYIELEHKMIDNWEAPLLNNLFTVIMMIISGKVIAKSKLNSLYPNFINDSLFAQSDVISVRIVNEFKLILNYIKSDEGLKNLFGNKNPKEIYDNLQSDTYDIYQIISDYIKSYGDRSSQAELKMETITYKEDPVTFIAYIKENLKYDFEQKNNQIVFDYKSIVRKHYKYNLVYRILISWVVKKTINRVSDRENFRFMRTRTYGLVRRIFREIDSKLLSDNLVHEKNDSLYLKLDELLNPINSTDFKEIIKKRKVKYVEYSDIDRSTRYVQKGEELSTIEPDLENISESGIKGIGCCSGVVKAEVRIFDNDSELPEDTEGKIFIANYFEPGKLGLFAQAKGLISARGNLLGHTAILCREMGIPSIVGAKTILNRLKDGDVIEMNGSTGKIEIIKNDK